ncbi:MAG: SusD/RagB family nutrient-binding outer membrane lipoprotein, partial [Bacteroidetes bacterium]|nr:SusD/RagB family nutrient-binding outer membrane lipoprotein [Bacteroidota bacterium]
TAYEAGIVASMARWGCVDGGTISPSYTNWAREVFTLPDTQNIDYATYLAHLLVDWNAAANNGEKYQRILEQKWAAGFTQGWQVWHEARRTGFPARIFEYELKGTYFPDLGMPVRIRINEEEALLNAENFEKAQNRQNIEETNFGLFSTNGIKSQMWWHTRKNPIPTEIDPPAK